LICGCMVILFCLYYILFFFSSRRRHTRSKRDWSSDVCSSDLEPQRSCLPLTLVPLLSERWKGTGPRQRNLEVIVHGTLVRRMEPLKALFFPSAEIKLPWTQTRSRVVS